MKRLLMLAAFGGLLFTLVPRSSAAINYNSSKSNTGNITYPPNVVTADQVLIIRKEIDKATPMALDEPAVRGALKTAGVKEGSVKTVIVERGQGGKGYSVLLLADPADEATARKAGGLPGRMKSGQ